MESAQNHPPAGKSMYDIYQTEAEWYDALVACEDAEGNFASTLLDVAPWDGASVVEAGIGTGRVTRIYAPHARHVYGYDRAAHMLERARANLAPWEDRLTLGVADNLSLPQWSGPTDDAPRILVEGWSFGHVAVDHAADVVGVTDRLVAGAVAAIGSAASLVFIETLGTNVKEPAPPADALAHFYRLLEDEHGFARRTVQTDYVFDSLDEAVSLMGFFFGSAMADTVAARGSARIPEFTGIWTRPV